MHQQNDATLSEYRSFLFSVVLSIVLYYFAMEFDYESNTKQFLNFLKFLGKLSNMEQRSFIDNATSKHVNILVNFIRLCSSGKVLCHDQTLFNNLAKFSKVFFNLKMARNSKTNVAEKTHAFKQVLHDRYGLLNLLAPYLEQSLVEYEQGGQLGINPVPLLPKMFTRKRTRTRRQKPVCGEKQVTESKDERSVSVRSQEEKEIKTMEEEKDFNHITVKIY